MVKSKNIKIGLSLLAVLVLGRFFCGMYQDDEFNQKYFFIKNVPTWKWNFYSPIGMSDLKPDEMSSEQKKEQLMYDQFIPKKLLSFPL